MIQAAATAAVAQLRAAAPPELATEPDALIQTTAVLAMAAELVLVPVPLLVELATEPDALIRTTAVLVLVPVLLLAELATEPDALIRTTAEPVTAAETDALIQTAAPVELTAAVRRPAAMTLAKSLS